MTTKKFITKNGLRTQNIDFTSPDDASEVLLQFSNDSVLSIEGTAGQLFSIADDMTGTIFSVNDVSGIPSIEVLDTGLVKIAQYSGNVLLGTASDNGSKLQVAGNISSDRLSLTIATGTAPLIVNSTTLVTNLNADLWDGNHFSSYLNQAVLTTSSPTFNNLTLSGDLTVNGTATTINAVTLTVDDKNIELGSVASPTDVTANGGGITLKGTTDKTIIWNSASAAWEFNQPIKFTFSSVSTGVDLNNNNLINANLLSFADPGDEAFITWNNGNDWKIRETDNALTGNVAGNLQFSSGNTRIATLNTSGQLELPVATGTAPLVIASTTRVANLNVASAGNADTVTNGVYTTGDQSISGLKTFANSELRIGNSDIANYISFSGTTGDQPGSFTHTFIGENRYSGTESSELLIFKGNDLETASGPDRIRHIAANHVFQTYTSALSGTFATVAASAIPTTRMIIRQNGNVGIGTNNPGFQLEVNGSFAASSKSFLIPHPTKEGKKLRHGSLEGPEHGVYIRGKIQGSIIELPEYWTKLVDPNSITVQLTAIGKGQKLYVEDISDNKVYIGNDGLFASKPNCFYYIQAERIDVDKLEVEID